MEAMKNFKKKYNLGCVYLKHLIYYFVEKRSEEAKKIDRVHYAEKSKERGTEVYTVSGRNIKWPTAGEGSLLYQRTTEDFPKNDVGMCHKKMDVPWRRMKRDGPCTFKPRKERKKDVYIRIGIQIVLPPALDENEMYGIAKVEDIRNNAEKKFPEEDFTSALKNKSVIVLQKEKESNSYTTMEENIDLVNNQGDSDRILDALKYVQNAESCSVIEVYQRYPKCQVLREHIMTPNGKLKRIIFQYSTEEEMIWLGVQFHSNGTFELILYIQEESVTAIGGEFTDFTMTRMIVLLSSNKCYFRIQMSVQSVILCKMTGCCIQRALQEGVLECCLGKNISGLDVFESTLNVILSWRGHYEKEIPPEFFDEHSEYKFSFTSSRHEKCALLQLQTNLNVQTSQKSTPEVCIEERKRSGGIAMSPREHNQNSIYLHFDRRQNFRTQHVQKKKVTQTNKQKICNPAPRNTNQGAVLHTQDQMKTLSMRQKGMQSTTHNQTHRPRKFCKGLENKAASLKNHGNCFFIEDSTKNSEKDSRKPRNGSTWRKKRQATTFFQKQFMYKDNSTAGKQDQKQHAKPRKKIQISLSKKKSSCVMTQKSIKCKGKRNAETKRNRRKQKEKPQTTTLKSKLLADNMLPARKMRKRLPQSKQKSKQMTSTICLSRQTQRENFSKQSGRVTWKPTPNISRKKPSSTEQKRIMSKMKNEVSHLEKGKIGVSLKRRRKTKCSTGTSDKVKKCRKKGYFFTPPEQKQRRNVLRGDSGLGKHPGYSAIISLQNIWLWIFLILVLSTRGDGLSCSSAIRLSVREKTSCPTSQKEWEEGINMCKSAQYSCTEKLKYHCVINDNGNEYVEVCAPNTKITQTFCAEYNSGINRIQPHQSSSCKSCIVSYDSSEGYKHPECLDKLQPENVQKGLPDEMINTTASVLQNYTSQVTGIHYSPTKKESSQLFKSLMTVVYAVLILMAAIRIALIFVLKIKQKETLMIEIVVVEQ